MKRILPFALRPSPLPWRLRRQLYQQTQAQLDNGKGLLEALEDFAMRQARRGRARAAQAVRQAIASVRAGQRFSEAIGPWMSHLERSVLTAAERNARAGSLARAMRLVLTIADMNSALRAKVLASFISPAVYLLTLYAALLFIGAFLVPQFLDTLPLSRWTGWAYVMYAMGQLAVGWPAPVLFGGLAAYAVVATYALPRWTHPRWRRLADRYLLPFTLYRETVGATWLMAYAALIQVGVPETSALLTQQQGATPWLASRLAPIHIGMTVHGDDLPGAMRRARTEFPSVDLIDDIAAYAGFVNFPEKIEVVALGYSQHVQRKLLVSASVVSAVITMGLFAAFFALQMGANALSTILSSSLGGT